MQKLFENWRFYLLEQIKPKSRYRAVDVDEDLPDWGKIRDTYGDAAVDAHVQDLVKRKLITPAEAKKAGLHVAKPGGKPAAAKPAAAKPAAAKHEPEPALPPGPDRSPGALLAAEDDILKHWNLSFAERESLLVSKNAVPTRDTKLKNHFLKNFEAAKAAYIRARITNNKTNLLNYFKNTLKIPRKKREKALQHADTFMKSLTFHPVEMDPPAYTSGGNVHGEYIAKYHMIVLFGAKPGGAATRSSMNLTSLIYHEIGHAKDMITHYLGPKGLKYHKLKGMDISNSRALPGAGGTTGTGWSDETKTRSSGRLKGRSSMSATQKKKMKAIFKQFFFTDDLVRKELRGQGTPDDVEHSKWAHELYASLEEFLIALGGKIEPQQIKYLCKFKEEMKNYDPEYGPDEFKNYSVDASSEETKKYNRLMRKYKKNKKNWDDGTTAKRYKAALKRSRKGGGTVVLRPRRPLPPKEPKRPKRYNINSFIKDINKNGGTKDQKIIAHSIFKNEILKRLNCKGNSVKVIDAINTIASVGRGGEGQKDPTTGIMPRRGLSENKKLKLKLKLIL